MTSAEAQTGATADSWQQTTSTQISDMKLPELRTGDHVCGDCGRPNGTVPEWMDTARYRRGREFFLKHVAAIMFSLHLSLVSGLSIPNLLNPLVYTEKSNTAVKALKRYFHTFLHIVLWQTGDIFEAPDGKAHKSVNLVRTMHNCTASKMNKDKEPGEKLFLSQYDMGLVQSGFFGAVIMYPEEFGIVCSRQELSDYVFVWRCIGYKLGIEERYNICLEGLDVAYQICKEIEQDVLIPSLVSPPRDFDKMSEAYIHGINNIPAGFKFMSREALFALMNTRWNLDMPKLKCLDILRLFFLRTFVFLIRWCPFFERICNHILLKLFQKQLPLLKL